MSIYGKVPVFDCKTDEWVVHVAQLYNFFIANGIDDITDVQRVRRRAILLNGMLQDSYRLTRDLLYPNTPESTYYKVIVATLDGHFDPKKCIYDERQKFCSAKKDPHESMVEYAARLRGLASACCFGTALEMCLTDRFVLGLDSASARGKLFREDPNQLKLNKALEVACAVESAQRIVSASDSAELIKSEPVLYTNSQRKATASGGTRGGRARGGSDGGALRCSVCGARSHDTSDMADVDDVTSYVNTLVAAGVPLPASLDKLRATFHKDKFLSPVMQYVTKSWPRKVSSELLPYNRCQRELYVDSGVLMRGHKIVMPTVYRAAVLQELHAAHLGVIKMKMIARERCWYPGIDSDIENMASNCGRCISL
ncbi:unnamed protein product [Parnassius mnemosyne]|uniref:RNA-directed DNA polymerase n=1 Tax=Parnassius mnemosyne TaxID=213953 RepID=A0AAV1LSH8_9NEOP